MSAKTDVMELHELKIEIKRVAGELKKLRTAEKEIENRLTKYLSETNQPGIKYGTTAIVLEEKTPHSRKKKKEVEEDTVKILKRHGISNPEDVMKDLDDARKGSPVFKQKIRLQKLSQR